jgi:3-hydroxyacyl-CoA dehydrogenase
MLGKKTKVGFYKTDLTPEWKKSARSSTRPPCEYAEYNKAELPCLAAAKAAKTLAGKNEGRCIRRRQGRQIRLESHASNLIYAANRIPEISDTIVEIDNAMKWGYNFEMGPFETWDAIGVAESGEKDGSRRHGRSRKVKAMLAAGNDRPSTN